MPSHVKQVFLFAGQGAQFYQMGRDLYENVPSFQVAIEHLDGIFQKLEGISLLDVIYGPKTFADPFDDVRWSHPALFIVQHALATALIKEGIRPDQLLGFSLGEYIARTVAQEFDVEPVLDALNAQARLLAIHAPKGFMIATLATKEALSANQDVMQLARFGAFGPEKITILVGRAENLPALKQVLRKLGISLSVLPVQIPFHSEWVDAAEKPWRLAVGALMPRQGNIPVAGHDTMDLTDQVPTLWRIVRNTADFPAKLRYIDPDRETRFIDLGPSSTMSNWVRHMSLARPNWTTHPVMQMPGKGDSARFETLLGL